MNLWFNSTVLSVRTRTDVHGKQRKEALVGFRVYEATGDKIDEIGRYRGWNQRFDEWISVYSPRLLPYNWAGRPWKTAVVHPNEDKCIDDSNDFTELSCFAVTRPGHSRSRALVRSINRFGQAGLFD